MKSKIKNNSFHVIKTISEEISLDFSNTNISKKLNKLIKLKKRIKGKSSNNFKKRKKKYNKKKTAKNRSNKSK